jgi:hypothetical protein
MTQGTPLKPQKPFAVSAHCPMSYSCWKTPDAFNRIRENARRTILEHYDLCTQCLPAQWRFVREMTDKME